MLARQAKRLAVFLMSLYLDCKIHRIPPNLKFDLVFHHFALDKLSISCILARPKQLN